MCTQRKTNKRRLVKEINCAPKTLESAIEGSELADADFRLVMLQLALLYKDVAANSDFKPEK